MRGTQKLSKRGAVCTFTNRLDLVGQINVAGISLGGLGSAWYVTSPLFGTSTQRRQLARTSRQGVPAPPAASPPTRFRSAAT